ncbi:SEC10/PgrA surface exclusion domain-containing protein [Streptococcus ictaluri]|uniref:Surface exclusion protein n=1 Tax=Streptococcus ictaluri 707-05 TaxID=764299 RepID=G5K4X8_9STRE|nr:SEC10/PgrA surface exclusion domain-containing protein [Streptococcus ictaluri]EHI69023.1 hypothetical protein STRIC_1865 [Streptococcus ictaluri 707-05]
MELENPKSSHVKNKIALTSTIALLSASVGVSHQVKADDVKTNDTQATNANDDNLIKPETLDEALAAVENVDRQIGQQKRELKYVDSEIAHAESEVALLETLKNNETATVDNTEKALQSVVTVSDEELATQRDKTQASLTSTTNQLVQSQAELTTEESNRLAQEERVASEAAQASQLAKELSAVDQKVASLNDMISQPEAVTSQANEASHAVKSLAQDLEKAKSDLATIEETTKSLLQQDLLSNEAALREKEVELSKLVANQPSRQVNVSGSNVMKVPEGYPFEEIKKLTASGYIGTANYNRYYYDNAETIITKATPGHHINNYVDIPSDLDRIVDPDNLSPEIQNELGQFAADLINSVRQQLGLVPVIVTEGSQEFARLLTKEYKKTHGDFRPSFIYGQPGRNGHYGVGPHDKTIIEASAAAVGLRPNDDNMYENVGYFNDIHTVNGIKRGIFDSIRYMLFTDNLHGNVYGHAVNLLRVDKTNPNAPIYLGFSTSNVQSMNEHFVIFPESNILDANRFSKTPIAKTSQLVNDSARTQLLKSNIATIKARMVNLQSRLSHLSSEASIKSIQAKVDALQEKLALSQEKSSQLNKRVEGLSDSKGALRTQLLKAKEEQVALQGKLDKALATLASSKVALHHLESDLAKKVDKMASLKTRKAHLETLLELTTSSSGKVKLHQKLNKMKLALRLTSAQLITAKDNLQKLQDHKADLQSSIATAEQRLTLLHSLAQNNQFRPFGVLRNNLFPFAEPRMLKASSQEESEFEAIPTEETEEVLSTETLKKIARQVTKRSFSRTAQLVAESTGLAAGAMVEQASDILAAKANTSQASATNPMAPAASTSYGAGSSTTSNMTSDPKESTERALKAGVVMLAAVGLTGAKLKKDSE